MSASEHPTTTTLWASCATVEAKAPRLRPNPVTKPLPSRPVARCRSTRQILRRSRAGSATAQPSFVVGCIASDSVTICPGITPITRTSSPSDRMARSSRWICAAFIVLRTHPGTPLCGNGSAWPPSATRRPFLKTFDGRKSTRSGSRQKSAWLPGAIAPCSRSPCARAAPIEARTSASSAASPRSTAKRPCG
jgi:hypothetical protein